MSAESDRRSRAYQTSDSGNGDTDENPTVEKSATSGALRRTQATDHGVSSESQQEAEMTLLRRLVLGKDYEQLAAMREDLERVLTLEAALKDPVRQTAYISRVLSEAMLLRENQDQGISKALRPALSDAIKAVVRKNPQPVIEAVSPVIGPAIRRSVNDAIAGMLELLDKLLEHNFSFQALKWRIEAWRSGMRYSELVLLRTLVYRVEQVLLIHQETGLLLQHVESPHAGVRDPDLVGGMLTAVKDFVSDSFSDSEESAVQTMQVGDFKVIVEQGRFAMIAAIARGSPPIELVRATRETLETIELLYGDELEQFDGDAASYAKTRPLLEDCLKSQQRQVTKRKPFLVPMLAGLVALVLLVYWGFKSHQSDGVWTDALIALRAEPGIALIDANHGGDAYRIRGLRDPLSRDPEAVIGFEALSALDWEFEWRPYFSAEPPFLLARARQVLQPPPTVELSFDGGVLEVSGEASQRWIDSMLIQAPRIPGVSEYRHGDLRATGDDDQASMLWSGALKALRAEPGIVLTETSREGSVARVHGLLDPLAREPRAVIGPEAESKLNWEWYWRPFLSAEQELLLSRARQILQPPSTVDLSLDGSVLQLSGEAPQQWVDTMRFAVQGIPGITGFENGDLRGLDDKAEYREALARYRTEIEGTMLYFDVDAVTLARNQLHRLETLAKAMNELVPVAGELGVTPGFLVTGYADATGSRAKNRGLSFSRANRVVEELVARGVSDHLFLPLKMGVRAPKKPAETSEDRARNRRVAVKVILLSDGVGTTTN